MLSGLFSSPWTQGSSASRTPIGRVRSRSWVSSAQNATSSISHLSQVAHSASRIAKRLRERDGTRSLSPLGPPPEIRVPISGTRAIPTGATCPASRARQGVGRATDSAQRPVPLPTHTTRRPSGLYVRPSSSFSVPFHLSAPAASAVLCSRFPHPHSADPPQSHAHAHTIRGGDRPRTETSRWGRRRRRRFHRGPPLAGWLPY